jgi:membrane protease YdiL (CAAX protease family)
MPGLSQLKPLGWKPSLIIFLVMSATIYATHYWFAPAFQAATGQPYLVGYLIGWGVNMALVLSASLVAYKWEGRPFAWHAFADRYRLSRMNSTDWLWTLVVLLGTLGFYFGLAFTSRWLAALPILAPHPAFPDDLVTGKLIPGELFGMPLQGQWWILAVYLVGWLLNIFGEEFWYRGWMLLRQELAFGKHAWLVNGSMFTFQHWLQPWNSLAILPGALLAVYAVQRRRNTWITIIQHGLMNFTLFGYVLLGVMGWIG